MSKYGVFSGPYFPIIGLNTERQEVFSPNAGKSGPEKTPFWTLFTQCFVSNLEFCLPILSSLLISWNDNANTVDNAIIRSSRVVVFCKKGVLMNFQNSQENTFSRVSL